MRRKRVSSSSSQGRRRKKMEVWGKNQTFSILSKSEFAPHSQSFSGRTDTTHRHHKQSEREKSDAHV
jgi:hypothetical protein